MLKKNYQKTFFILLPFIATFIFYGLDVSAQLSQVNVRQIESQIETVRREREALLEEQRKLQVELEAINREAQTIGSAVRSLDATRRKLVADINLTQSKINDATANIRNLENTVTEKEWQIHLHRQAVAGTLAALANHDSRPLALSFLSSGDISEIWRDRAELETLSSRLEEEIKILRKTREDLVLEKATKEKIREEQLKLENQLSGQKTIVEENQKAKEKLLAETKNVEAEYQKMLAENVARQRQFEADLFRLESELRINLDPSLIPEPRPGILSWPLDNVFVTQRFGRTSASGRLYASGTHNGVDFRAAQGTPVKAMLSGVIDGIGNTDEQRGCGSYGRWILIKHPNGLSTIYAHLSASIVQKGQTVATGEVIGYSGGMPGVFGSGYSTGPHLHVGLFASQGVSVQQFVTSRGCTQVFVPIADVKAYLDPLAYLPALQ